MRLFLTPDQCDQLKAADLKFGVVHPSSYPASDFPGRHVLDVLPVSYDLACQILDVIEGRARVQKIKPKEPKA